MVITRREGQENAGVCVRCVPCGVCVRPCVSVNTHSPAPTPCSESWAAPRGDEHISHPDLGIYKPFSRTGNGTPRRQGRLQGRAGKHQKKLECLAVPESEETSRKEGDVPKCPGTTGRDTQWPSWGSSSIGINKGHAGLLAVEYDGKPRVPAAVSR